MLDSAFNELGVTPFGVSDSIVGEAYHSVQINDTLFMGVGVRRLPGNIRNSLLMFMNEEGEELGYHQIYNDDINSGLSSNLIHDIARINDSIFLASSYFRYGTESGQWGEMVIDTSGNIFKWHLEPQSSSAWTKLVKTVDNKYTIGCGWEEGKTDWDIYLYKINQQLEQDTIYPDIYIYDSLCSYPIQSGEVDISDCIIITDVGEVPTPGEYYSSLQKISIKAYPNPVDGNEVTFDLQNTNNHQNMELRFFNVLGELIHKEEIYWNQGKSKVGIQNWQAGIYMALIYSNNQLVGQTKVVVR